MTLTDGRVYSCSVTGTDDIVDIAVLKILPDEGPPMTNLPVAELGDSDQLKVGNIVIAVGSPGGLDNTVTMGIVSGRERSSMMVGIPHKLVNYIQTDAAINPGNSGRCQEIHLECLLLQSMYFVKLMSIQSLFLHL